ncbi:hypothetical protein CDEN61S_01829 [Castellaniella denitrificans]
MKRSRYSPMIESMICSSCLVPRVVTTSAWVSPRVNSAEPCARQHAQADADRAHGARVASVDARLAVQDLAADDFRFQGEQHVLDFDVVGRDVAPGRRVFGQLGLDVGVDLAQARGALLLVAQLIDGLQGIEGGRAHGGGQDFVARGGLPVPFGLAGFGHQFMDGVDAGLHLFMAEHHGTQHHVFGQLFGFGFDHQHGGFGPGDHQVQLGLAAHLRGAGVQDVLAVDVAHAGGAHRTVEGNAGDRQGGRGADQSGDVGIDFRIHRHRVDDDLDVVVEAFREQRTQRTVDQAGGQDFLFGGLAFALEEAAGDLAGRVGLFDVIDGQRKEILAGLGGLGGHHRGQHHRVVDGHQHRAAGLAGDFTGFQDDGVLTVLERLAHFIEHFLIL